MRGTKSQSRPASLHWPSSRKRHMDRPSRMKEIVSYAVDSSDNSDDDLLDSDMEEAAEVTTSRLRLKNLKNNGSSTDIDRNMELSPCHGELGIEEKDGLDVVTTIERFATQEESDQIATDTSTGKSSRGKKQSCSILDMLRAKSLKASDNTSNLKDEKKLCHEKGEERVDFYCLTAERGEDEEDGQTSEEFRITVRQESRVAQEKKGVQNDAWAVKDKVSKRTPKSAKTIRKARRKASAVKASGKDVRRGDRSSGRFDSMTGRMSQCKNLLKEVMKAEVELLKRKFDVHDCRWFSDPVDPVEMEIPDYPEIIKEPMCFLDIQKKLSESSYENTDQFIADMRLVFSNATTYNTDQNNPVHVVALQLSDLLEAQYRTVSQSWISAALNTGTYTEVGSDDEFIVPSAESSEDEGHDVERKMVERKVISNSSNKVDKRSNPTSLTSTSSNISSCDSEENEGDHDEDVKSDDDDIDYRIQHILCSKSLFPFEWQATCEQMNTREVTRGSVWKQPDEEFFDKTPQKVEKFLIKWMHASYLHVSWEKEDDLINLVGGAAKIAIKKHRLRVASGGPEIFEDLARGEYFPSNYLRIGRIIDIEDPEVSIQKVDFINAQPKVINWEDSTAAINLESPLKSNDEQDVLPDSPFSALAKKTSKNTIDAGSSLALLADSCFSPVQESVSSTINVVEDESTVHVAEVVPNETSLDGFDLNIEGDDAIISSPGNGKDLETVTCVLPLGIDSDAPEKEVANIDNPFGIDVGDDSDGNEKNDGRNNGNNSFRRSTRIVKSVQIFDPQPDVRATRKSRTPRAAIKFSSSPKSKKNRGCDPLVLHGGECWVTIKWDGLPYEDCSFEALADICSMGVEYEAAMRAFYKREQRTPAVRGRPRKVKRSLDNEECNSKESPKFPNRELRDYQWEGVRWLLFNWSQKRNSILADEMGLGKTIQSAGFLQLLKRHQGVAGPFLIVAPLSTIVNWQRELTEWTDMDSIIYHGSIEDRQLIREHEFYYMSRNKKEGHKVEIVITTPEICLAADSKTSTGRVHRELAQIDWDVLIVDEAHKLKNHNSKFTSAIREEFSFQSCLLLTGTPLQNNTDELWTLLNFVDKNKFCDKEKFAADYGELKTTAQLEKIHKLIRPYILRREKENVEKAVPPKEEVIVEVELTIPQKQYYRAIYEQNTQFLYKGGAKDGPRLSNLAMELRKCCNHPFLVKGAEMDIVRQAQQDEVLNSSETGYVDTLVGSSGKMVLLDKLLPKLQSQGHRVLVFSQFRIMLDIIEDYLIMKRYSYDRVDGSVTGKKRQSAIDKYSDANSDVFVMLLSTRAGGVGINLTAADTVIIFDSDWNPQNDLQAQARAHRIGQTKPVKVYRLLTKKSYEMHMFHAASVKLGLAYAIAGGKNPNEVDVDVQKNKSFSSLSKKELESLLRHGAYDIFNENKDSTGEDESRNFCDADIDNILERSSVVIHGSKGSVAQTSSFSKASFVASGGEENDIDLEDPEFWAKVVGLGFVEEEEVTGRRRKCRGLVGEGSYKEPGMRFATYQSSSESDSDAEESQPKGKRVKKEKSSFITADFSDRYQMTRLANVLFSCGYGRWTTIRKDARLKWTQADIAKGCRTIIIQLLITMFNLESFDGFSKGNSSNGRSSFAGVADRLSLSPSSGKEPADEHKCILDFMDKMRFCKVARLALASALLDSNTSSTDASLVNSDLITPKEDEIIAQTLNKSICEITADKLPPLVVFSESTAFKEWNSSYFDEDTPDENFKTFADKAANVIMTIKSMCPDRSITADEDEAVASTFDDVALTKAKATRLRAEERLTQLENMFELQMASMVISGACADHGQSKLSKEVVTGINEDRTTIAESDAEVTSMHIMDGSSVKDIAKETIGSVEKFGTKDIDKSEERNLLEYYLEKIFDLEESSEQPLLSIRATFSWWSVKHDAALIKAVQNVGWPDSKKKFVAVESTCAHFLVELTDDATTDLNSMNEGKDDTVVSVEDRQVGNTSKVEVITERKVENEQKMSSEEKVVLVKEPFEEGEIVKKAFPTGFPFKDRHDLSKRLRSFSSVFRLGITHSPYSCSTKKLAQNVLKAMAKMGRPRTLYTEMIDGQCSHGINCANSECEEAHLYRSEYLMKNWEKLTKECGVKVITESWIDRVRSVAEEILAGREELSAIQKSKGVSFTNPNSLLTSAEISVKVYVDSMEKCEMMHRIRSTLAAFPDDFIVEMIRANTKIPFAGPMDPSSKTVPLRKGEKEREQDTVMPVWWNWNYDVALLKILAKNGLANYKKLLSEAKSFTDTTGLDITVAPDDFEMPPLENNNPWTMDLTAKAVEKRALSLGKNIQPVRWLKLEQMKGKHSDFPPLPPGSPGDRLQHVPAPSVKPRDLFTKSNINNTSVSKFFVAAPKKQIGPSTKPGESIKGIAATMAPILERASSSTLTTLDNSNIDQNCVAVDLAIKDMMPVDTIGLRSTEASSPLSSKMNTDEKGVLKGLDNDVTDADSLIEVSNPTMKFVPVENVTELETAEINPPVVQKKRKAMSDETKAAMMAKRKATIAAKKTLTYASSVDVKLAAMTVEQLEEAVLNLRDRMKDAVTSEEFETAAYLKKEIMKHEEAMTGIKEKLATDVVYDCATSVCPVSIASNTEEQCNDPEGTTKDASCHAVSAPTTATNFVASVKKTPTTKATKKAPNASVGAKGSVISSFFKKIEMPVASTSIDGSDDEIGTVNILQGINGDASPVV